MPGSRDLPPDDRPLCSTTEVLDRQPRNRSSCTLRCRSSGPGSDGAPLRGVGRSADRSSSQTRPRLGEPAVADPGDSDGDVQPKKP